MIILLHEQNGHLQRNCSAVGLNDTLLRPEPTKATAKPLFIEVVMSLSSY